MPVNSQHQQYKDAAPKWKRVRDCFDGRDAIIAAGQTYLPCPPQIQKGFTAYQVRAHFFPAVKRTVQALVGMIFQKPPKVEGADKALEAVLSDIEPRGQAHLDQFAQRLCRELWLPGRFGVRTDLAPAEPGSPAAAPRPFAVMYKAEDILSWRTGIVGGNEILTRVVLSETREAEDPKDPFVTKQIQRCRVLELGADPARLGSAAVYTQTMYERKDPDDVNSEWAPVPNETGIKPQRRGAPLDFIPFTIVGPTGVGPDVEDPPLLDLADVNLGHYRNSATHEQGLHYVGLPTPYIAGAAPADDGKGIPLGPENMVILTEGGSAGMLEYKGEGIKDIRQAMEDKKSEMAALGARLLETTKEAPETATAIRLRHGGEQATVGTVAEALEQALTIIVQQLGWWLGLEAKPADVKVTVALNKEFFALKATPEEVKVLLLALQAGEISYETFYQGLQRGGWARDGVTVEQELSDIKRDAARKPEPEPEPEPMPAAA